MVLGSKFLILIVTDFNCKLIQFMKKRATLELQKKEYDKQDRNQRFQNNAQRINSVNRLISDSQMDSWSILKQHKAVLPDNLPNQTDQRLKCREGQSSPTSGMMKQEVTYEKMDPLRREITTRPKLSTRNLSKKKLNQLNDIVFAQKVARLKHNFIQKLKRNNPHSQPLQCNIFAQQERKSDCLNANGIQVGQNVACLINILFVANIISTTVIQSLCIVFKELTDSRAVQALQILGIVIYFLQILLNLVTVRINLGRKLQTLKEISSDYIGQSFYIDIINVTIIILNLVTSSSVLVLNLFKIFILLKFPDWLCRIKKLEVQFIENYYKEQYWSVIKVFLFNFIYAHFLSIVLLSMASINQDNNWLLFKGLDNASWQQQYVWSYYWSTTIMLTIGFGDITPKCSQQALVMIFVEIVSCIILAYNINCLGTLITNIRSQDQQKHKNLKIFKRLSEDNLVSEELTWKINSFIQENSNIKKFTNVEEQGKFVENLPSNYKVSYLKESNRHVFKKIYFFSTLMERTLCALSQKIKAKITHPLQVLLNKQSNLDLLILKKGEIACRPKMRFMNFPNLLINRVKVQDNDTPFLLHTNFITKACSSFQILSTVYSLLYYLDYESLIEAFRGFCKDFELYCQLRDKSKYYLDEFQVFRCEKCNSWHSEFDCPKYHFIPFKQHVIQKESVLQKKIKNRRATFMRVKETNQQRFYILSDSKQPESDGQNSEYASLRKRQMRKQLSKVLKQRSQAFQSLDKAHILERQICDTVAEAINTQLTHLLQAKEGEDPVWIVESDGMQDYKNYFPRNNPQRLQQAFKAKPATQRIEQLQLQLTPFKLRKRNTLDLESRKKLNHMQSKLRRKKLEGIVTDETSKKLSFF